MSAALLLTMAMAGGHDCYSPTHASSYHAAPYHSNYGYAAPHAYGSPSHGSAYYSPSRGYASNSNYQQRAAGYAPRQTSGIAVVQMTDRARFEPAQITINVGDTVEWRNVSRHPHTVTANPELAKNPARVVLPEGARPFHSPDVAPGGRFSHRFTVPGTYYYVCLPHEEMGMVGVVVVKDPQGQQPDAYAPAQQRGNQSGRTY
jgi:plastocyanin